MVEFKKETFVSAEENFTGISDNLLVFKGDVFHHGGNNSLASTDSEWGGFWC